ncbi:uncharacterized protein VTP21DRAFT_7913 [Calcarisporiella thermophila]|uniref:uncharacterized protein n=1 Tax=Calcarisporiella thermophila TaxID=911321 RepID=UPI0037433DAB
MDVIATRNWLRTALQAYPEHERVFLDVDAVLQSYPSLKPRMDNYTYETGRTDLLLCLHGTIPINFRSTGYNIPVYFWVPLQYPTTEPLAYVKPTAQMLIRPGRHVDVNGKCYHPYMAYWNPDENSLVGLISHLQRVFSQEPPVYQKPVTYPTPPKSISMPPSEGGFRDPSPAYLGTPSTSSRQTTTHPPLIVPERPAPYYNDNLSDLMTSPPPPALPSHNGASARTPTVSDRSNSSPAISPKPLPPRPLNHSLTYLPASASPLSPPSVGSEGMTALQQEVYEKLQGRLQEFNAQVSHDMEQLLATNRLLNEGEARIEEEKRVMEDLDKKIELNMVILKRKCDEIQETIDKASQIPEMQVDELICGTTVVYNQLIEQVAEENAIADTIYYLGKALDHGRLDLAVFLKHVRILSREQFMRRALINKIRAHAGLHR